MHDPYLTIPPTSGARAAESPALGIYESELANLDQVAALAEGAVLVQYSCPPAASLCSGIVDELMDIVESYSGQPVILAPYRAAATSHITLTAWGSLLRLNAVDELAVREFIEAFAGAVVDSGG